MTNSCPASCPALPAVVTAHTRLTIWTLSPGSAAPDLNSYNSYRQHKQNHPACTYYFLPPQLQSRIRIRPRYFIRLQWRQMRSGMNDTTLSDQRDNPINHRVGKSRSPCFRL